MFGGSARGIRGRDAAVWCAQRLVLTALVAVLALGALFSLALGTDNPRIPVVVGFGIMLGVLSAVFLRAHRGVDRLRRPQGRALARASVAAQAWGYLGSGAALIALRLLAPDLDTSAPVISAGIGGATFGALALAVRATEALAHARLDDVVPHRNDGAAIYRAPARAERADARRPRSGGDDQGMDPERARRNFLNGLDRTEAGLQRQRERIIAWTAAAPQLVPGVSDLRGTPSHDLDYYVYELGRLQDIARKVSDVFEDPPEVVAALAAFEQAIPELRRIRNPLTHIDGRDRLANVAWFDSVVEVGPGGAVTYLVDPRHGHHDAALTLARDLREFLADRSGPHPHREPPEPPPAR